MPELPEVEQVRQGLRSQILGKKIKQVDIYWDRIIAEPSVKQFKEQLSGQTFHEIKRRGKFLLFILDNYVLISHLRMEGKYQVVTRKVPLSKHTHVVFKLTDGSDLRYHDVRKFGRMSLVSKDEETSHPSLRRLGPEPTQADLTLEWMTNFIKNRTKAIKAVLLDQHFVAGIGNIYADEILFRAQIHPATSCKNLTPQDLKTIRRYIIEVIAEAKRAGGTTVRSYTNALGKSGHFQEQLQVYGRQGEPCVVCQTPIEKIKVTGRGTHFCPHCQGVKRL